MTQAHENDRKSAVPTLEELTVRYLRRPNAVEEAPDVLPYEAVSGLRVDARQAWSDATAALAQFAPLPGEASAAPPEWSAVVAASGSEPVVLMAAGNFPQRLRDLTELLDSAAFAAPASEGAPLPAGLRNWVERQKRATTAAGMLAAGVLRRAGEMDQAAELLRRLRADAAPEWEAALANEEASLLWQAGRREEAAKAWAAQRPSVPVLFNRGVAALVLGRRAEARTALAAAVEGLPDTTAWHHLARLYLALAQM
jgi:tetratricopeptide (TPR) repeat protein